MSFWFQGRGWGKVEGDRWECTCQLQQRGTRVVARKPGVHAAWRRRHEKKGAEPAEGIPGESFCKGQLERWPRCGQSSYSVTVQQIVFPGLCGGKLDLHETYDPQIFYMPHNLKKPWIVNIYNIETNVILIYVLRLIPTVSGFSSP